jgi:ParB family transcriptional regulator, chromosome partitioning protein
VEVVRKVERFASAPLAASLRSREGHAARIADIDRRVGEIVEHLKQRGFRSPYLRAFVVARVNPVRWIREKRGPSAKPPMALGEALTRMARSIRQFDVGSVKASELAMVAALAAPEGD